MQQHTRSFLEVSLSSLLIAFSALFAKVLPFSPHHIIFLRAAITCVALLIFLKLTKKNITLRSKKDYLMVLLIGALLASHWVLYYTALQLSTIALGIIALFTYPAITAVLEPYFFNYQHVKKELISSFLVLIGIVLIVPAFTLENTMTLGIVTGVCTAFVFSLRNLLSKKYLSHYSGAQTMVWQTGVATLLLFPLFFFNTPQLTTKPLFLILLLGLFFTAIPHTLFVRNLSKIKATTVSIIMSMQPVYGILIGYFFLSEVPSLRTLIGGILIIITVFYATLTHRDLTEKKSLSS